MDKPVNHYGDVIIAIVAIGLLVSLTYLIKQPLANGLNTLINNFTAQGSNQIMNMNTSF